MTRRPLLLLAAAAAVAVGVVAPVTAAAQVSQPRQRTVVPSGSKTVPGVLAGLSRASREGAAPAERVLSIGVGVALPNITAEKALQAAIYDPKSPSYHHFLTPAQFDREFSVSAANQTAITRWLKADGLKVTSVSDDGSYVMATGTVAQLDQRFHVAIGAYSDKQSGQFLANSTAPTVPANLPITAVLGLSTVQTVRTAVAQSHQTPRRLTATAAGSFEGVFTPENLWGAYDQPATDEGQGETLGIFGEGTTDPVVTQLRLFEHRFNLPKIPVQTVYTQPGAPATATSPGTGGDNGGNIEWYLDAQASTGMAPKARELQFWFSNTLYDPDIAASFSKWVATPACSPSSPIAATTTAVCAPLQMNASFGECEATVGNGLTGPLSQLPYGTELGDELEPVAEPMLLKATMEGRTLFASAGDTGSGCPEVVVPVLGAGNGVAPQPVPIPNYPCTSAYAVCVGGTVLTEDDPTGKGAEDTGPTSTHNIRVNEISWQDTGGGSSHSIMQPTFQKNVLSPTETLEATCAASYNGTVYAPGSVCRTIPDVAALSGNITGNGYFIYLDGSPSSEGGTSLSSPLTMGMWARIQAAAANPAVGNGFADDTYYSHYGTNDSTGNFFDVTCVEEAAGLDPNCASTGVSSTNGAYAAGAGYDLTSGLGVPDIGKLLMAVDGTKIARLAQTEPEAPQLIESTVTDVSPVGNAADPAVANPLRGLPVAGGIGNTLTALPAADLATTTLTTSPDGKTVTATLTGPTLSATPDVGATGENYVIYWYEAGSQDVYFLKAATSATGAPTYTAGDTKSGRFTTIAAATVTGTFTGNTVKMTAPLAALGAPAVGSLLQDPSANSQFVAGLAFVADTAAADSTAAQSRGQAVCVGGCATAIVPPATGAAPTTTTKTTTTSSATTPTELAFTGLTVLVPVTALVLLGGGGAAYGLTRRRRSGL